jgi:hypothetical protein
MAFTAVRSTRFPSVLSNELLKTVLRANGKEVRKKHAARAS